MKLNRLLFIVLSALVVLSLSTAQPRRDRVEMQLQRIKEKVGLTEEQTVKVKEIMQRAQNEMRAQFDQSEKNDGDLQARRKAMAERMEKTDAKILTLLTGKQKQQYEEYKNQRQKEMQERMRERQ